MNNFTTTVVKQKEFIDSVKTVLHINKIDKSEITPDEVKKMTEKILKKAPEGSKLMIRGLNPMHWSTLGKAQWITLKNMDNDLNIKDEDEYYQGEVKETAKFYKFSQLEIILIKPN
jgi:translation elongation factor EF-G